MVKYIEALTLPDWAFALKAPVEGAFSFSAITVQTALLPRTCYGVFSGLQMIPAHHSGMSFHCIFALHITQETDRKPRVSNVGAPQPES